MEQEENFKLFNCSPSDEVTYVNVKVQLVVVTSRRPRYQLSLRESHAGPKVPKVIELLVLFRPHHFFNPFDCQTALLVLKQIVQIQADFASLDRSSHIHYTDRFDPST